MSLDDKLREAFDRSAPVAPDAARARGQLGSAMVRARRHYRIRRGVAAVTLSLAVAGGGAAAAVQLSGSGDNEVDSRTSTLPPPDTTAPAMPVDPGPEPTTDNPEDDDKVPTSTALTTTTTTSPPETTSSPTTTSSTPTTTVSEVPATLSGPHATPCGSVTFAVTATVAVDSHTVESGYVFSTEREGTTEVEAKWSLGPGDECQIEAHLEDGTLMVHFDEE